MRHLLLSIVIFMSGFMPMTASASVSPQAQYRVPVGVDQMVARGNYSIYVYRNNSWQSAGSLEFDAFLRTRKIDLDPFLKPGERPLVRLVQYGGGASHIDSILLGGMPPAKIIDNPDLKTLEKIADADFDVIDCSKKSFDIIFTPDTPNRVFSLTARVEPEQIGTIPFRFPITNQYKPITDHSDFYVYDFSESNSAPNKWRPIFSEFCYPGSGHPYGTTYGWVRSDDEALYVQIDFTPDNTLDGGKDYAKVWIRTKDGTKGFTVTSLDTSWGTSEFIYTDKVEYQHKLYNFKIPYSDIGRPAKEFELAFEAYGTAAVNVLVGDKVDTLIVDNNGDGIANPGDTLRYQIEITNWEPSITAENVTFTDTPDQNTTLVVGSVSTSQGTVTTGNGAGDSSVAIDIGSIAPNQGTAEVQFDVIITPNAVPQVSNQGSLTSTTLVSSLTSDPDGGQQFQPTLTAVTANPDPIPTLSEWGIILLTLLFFLTATRKLTRKEV